VVDAESPRAAPAPPCTWHPLAAGRAPRRAAFSRSAGCEGRPRGDRLDKAGQPGGPVSAVYSPAAALRHAGHAPKGRACVGRWSHRLACAAAGAPAGRRL